MNVLQVPVLIVGGGEDAQRRSGDTLRHQRRTDQVRVLDLVHRIEERIGHHHVPHAPARHAVRLRQRVERDRVRQTLRVGRGRIVPGVAVGEVFVHLVGDVDDAPLGAQPIDGPQRGFGIDRATRVVGRDRHNRPRSRGERTLERVEVELVVGVRRDGHRAAPDRPLHGRAGRSCRRHGVRGDGRRPGACGRVRSGGLPAGGGNAALRAARLGVRRRPGVTGRPATAAARRERRG